MKVAEIFDQLQALFDVDIGFYLREKGAELCISQVAEIAVVAVFFAIKPHEAVAGGILF